MALTLIGLVAVDTSSMGWEPSSLVAVAQVVIMAVSWLEDQELKLNSCDY